MAHIVVIGTIHGRTPRRELEEVLDEISPDLLLVEIAEEDLKKEEIEKYPEEMVAACQWAKENGVQTHGFDVDIDVFRKGVGEEENERVIELQKEVMGKISWKNMNQEENLKLLDIPEARSLVDHKKEEEREKLMLSNIKGHIEHEGTVVVITGCGHLEFLEQEVPSAHFPFRE